MYRIWNVWSQWSSRCDLEVSLWAPSGEQALELAHRQGVAWGYGYRADYIGLHAQIAVQCEGCDGVCAHAGELGAFVIALLPTQPYIVTDHEGKEHAVRYCDGCAELAAVNWNGETSAIRPMGAHGGLFKECDEERYGEMLGVVFPVAWVSKGFLMGEPLSHRTCDKTGHYLATYRAMVRHGDRYYESTRGLTVPEWRALDCSQMP